MKIPLLHGIIMRYAFAHQPKPDTFADTEFAFIDSKGIRYYLYTDYFNLPLPRREELDRLLIMMSARVNDEDLQDWIECMEKTLQQPDKPKANTTALQMVGALKTRQAVEINEGILFKMACTVYVREDQNPLVWDEEIEREKIAQLKKDFSESGGLRDFFLNAGLKHCLPSWIYTDNGLTEYLEIQQEQIARFTELTRELKENLISSGTTGA